MTEDRGLRPVVAGAESAGVVAAYGQAVDLAGRVRAMLVVAGVEAGTVQVVPSLSATGGPVVYLIPLTGQAGRLLAQILPGGAAAPPPCGPRDPPEHPPPDGAGGDHRVA